MKSLLRLLILTLLVFAGFSAFSISSSSTTRAAAIGPGGTGKPLPCGPGRGTCTN